MRLVVEIRLTDSFLGIGVESPEERLPQSKSSESKRHKAHRDLGRQIHEHTKIACQPGRFVWKSNSHPVNVNGVASLNARCGRQLRWRTCRFWFPSGNQG